MGFIAIFGLGFGAINPKVGTLILKPNVKLWNGTPVT